MPASRSGRAASPARRSQGHARRRVTESSRAVGLRPQEPWKLFHTRPSRTSASEVRDTTRSPGTRTSA